MNIKVIGAKELISDLKRVEKSVADKHTETALRAGAEVLKTAVERQAPEKSGELKQDIRIRKGKNHGNMAMRVIAGAGRAFYAGWVDVGHFMGARLRMRRSRGLSRGDREAAYHAASAASGRKWVEGKHFMDKAYEQSGEKAGEVAAQTLANLIEKEL